MNANRSLKLKLLVVSMAVILVLAILVAVFFSWQRQNQTVTAKITGSWYCVEEDVQFQFADDGSFSATNGQTTLLAGSWKTGFLGNTLILNCKIEDKVERLSTPFQFNEDQDQLKLTNVNSKSLTMKRLGDS